MPYDIHIMDEICFSQSHGVTDIIYWCNIRITINNALKKLSVEKYILLIAK